MTAFIRYLRTLLRRFWWMIVIGLAIVALVLGVLGFQEYYVVRGEHRSQLDAFYLAMQLFTLESGAIPGVVGWKLEVARLLAPVVAGYAAAKALIAIFDEQFDMLRLRYTRDHVIVCGLGRKGLWLVEQLRERGDRVVVIESDYQNDDLPHCRELGAIVLIGNASDAWVLGKSRVHRAKALVSVMGDDGANVETAVRVHGLNQKRRQGSLHCVIHIADSNLQSIFKRHDLFSEDSKSFELDVFNVYETSARIMLRELAEAYHLDISGDSAPHLLIVGFGEMGEALFGRAVRDWKIDHPQVSKKIRITILDQHMHEKKRLIAARYSSVDQIATVEFIEMDVPSADITRLTVLQGTSEQDQISVAYVCLDNESMGMYMALQLQGVLKKRQVPVIVRMSEESGLATLVSTKDNDRSPIDGVRAVGVLDTTCTLPFVLGGTREILARAIHQGYIQQQYQSGQTPTINPSMAPWDNLDESLQESNRAQSDDISDKMAAIGCKIRHAGDAEVSLFEFTTQEIEQLAEWEHKRWVAERRANGWTLGDEKDIENRITPYLIPWDELTEEVKEIDRNAVRRISAILAKAEFMIERGE